MTAKLRKSTNRKTITGTIGGISEYAEIDYTWLRISFVLLALVTKGWAILGYIVLSLLIPENKKSFGPTMEKHRSLKSRVMNFIKHLLKTIKTVLSVSRFRKIFGLTFLALGLLWIDKPLGGTSAVLMVIGVTLLFNPFGIPHGLKSGAVLQMKRNKFIYNFDIDSLTKDEEKQKQAETWEEYLKEEKGDLPRA